MRTVLVTGGSGGVGCSLVKRFAGAGDHVIFTYCNNQAAAEALMDSLQSGSVDVFRFDQGNPDSHQQLMGDLPPRIDVLINNAALGSATVTARSDSRREQDRLLFAVNAMGPLWLIQDIVPLMESNRSGKIINISSVGGGITQFAGFRLADGMSKAAVAHMTRQLAAELIHSPVDVFAVCPGATDTPMFDRSTLRGLSDEDRDTLIRNLPGRRMISADEIAEVCWFLAGSASACLHGAVIDASMGLGVNPGCLQK